MDPVNSNKRDFPPVLSTASANWKGREVTMGAALPPQECQKAFENLGKLTPSEFNKTLAKLGPLERDSIIEQYAVARSHFKGEKEPLFYMKEVLTFLKMNQSTSPPLLTKVIVNDLLDQMPSDKAIEAIEELQANFKFLTSRLVQEFYIEYFVACYSEREQDASKILLGFNKAQLEKALKALLKSWAALPRKEAYTKIEQLQKKFPQFSENSLKRSFEQARLLLEKPAKEKAKAPLQRPPVKKEFGKKNCLAI